MIKIRSYFSLFIAFFKIGLFTFGGGYAMISLIERDICQKKRWLTEEELFELIAIAESTPGPFAVNSATFIGYKRHKTIGSILATLGVVLPSFVVILTISIFLKNFNDNLYVKSILRGIQAGVGVLIFNAGFKLWNKLDDNLFNGIMLIIGFYFALFTNISLIIVLIFAAMIALIYSQTKIFDKLNEYKFIN